MVFPTWKSFKKVATATSFVTALFTGTTRFLPDACQRTEQFLESNIVGQELAIGQLVDAVCAHLEHLQPRKPLVLSIHGPPGVGKTFTSTLLARALYNKNPEKAVECPGKHCQGMKVVYGLDFEAHEQGRQLALVRNAIQEHMTNVKDAIVVIEEYHNLDCASRAMVRQLLDHPYQPQQVDGKKSSGLGRAIVLLESNHGTTELEGLMYNATKGGKQQLSAKDADHVLRDAVFANWQSKPSSSSGNGRSQQDGACKGGANDRDEDGSCSADGSGDGRSGVGGSVGCEGFMGDLRLTSHINFYLPFLPLQRPQVKELISRELLTWRGVLWNGWNGREYVEGKYVLMVWRPQVVDFLTDMVEFYGPFSIEGAKQASTVCVRHIARHVRRCPAFAISAPRPPGQWLPKGSPQDHDVELRLFLKRPNFHGNGDHSWMYPTSGVVKEKDKEGWELAVEYPTAPDVSKS
ncbi:hypothetical protein DUNSADRAFT_17844 [Dunaliella salina]|uniref:AAA+ ATPase domain-containing protein n=1 Tax=Dunaliella salina TaxID=3046 RepID=A0ABQ7G153_DUNSA|nr:hypothetical protein DUNSADRAFT_17844 [Dunaliella salina]|eukprot:KAF5828296.1 hypothetical protein DUNSADRAFT_17844 [Dunaliella salina]